MEVTHAEAEAWAAAHGTPLYAYDPAVARGRLRGLQAALGGAAEVWLALKANSHPALLAALAPDLAGVDVASAGELAVAAGAGFEGHRVGVTGPAKTPALLAAAVAAGAVVSVESREELGDLAALARGSGRRARALLRLNPAERIHAFRVATAGLATPFGIPQEDLHEAIAAARRHADAVSIEGVHVHAGSQCTSDAAWLRHATRTLDLADALANGLGQPPRLVNLGGGLGVAPPGTPGLDVARLGRKLAAALGRFRAAHGPEVRVVLEPGRFLWADAGVFLARVLRCPASRGVRFAALDGGLSAFLFAAERFHDGPPPTICNLSGAARPMVSVTVVGPACTPLDTLAREVRLPEPRPGDLLLFAQAGAYGWGASPHGFLLHDVPRELLRGPEGVQVILR